MDVSLRPQNPAVPSAEAITRRLLDKGVFPTPKMIYQIRKKEQWKSLRKSKRIKEKIPEKSLSKSRKLEVESDARYQTIADEYQTVTQMLQDKNGLPFESRKPWETQNEDLRGSRKGITEFGCVERREESFEGLTKLMAARSKERCSWSLDDDLEHKGPTEGEQRDAVSQLGRESDAIQALIGRLISSNVGMRDWLFSRLMDHSGVPYTERNMLTIVERLGVLGYWRHSLSVVDWVYNATEYRHHKSRSVYTRLLAVLGKARRSGEALCVFNHMCEAHCTYPDMAAYHSIAVTLGHAGFIEEILRIVDCMRHIPHLKLKHTRGKCQDPRLEPDIIIFNALLKACVSCQNWEKAFWVLSQIRDSGLVPNASTYEIAMEVMLTSEMYELVHMFFGKMLKIGFFPTVPACTVLVKAWSKQNKIDDAVEAVRDMEEKGVVGAGRVHYELASCLCFYGRWQEALNEIGKLGVTKFSKPLVVMFTRMIKSCMFGGHLNGCFSLFEHMKRRCAPNIRTINVMLKVCIHGDMFARAEELFESMKRGCFGTQLLPDRHTYHIMLEVSAIAHQWEYFEHIYREMTLCNYQLDEKIHAWMVIRASKAGKWHLLEHAFNVILEAGDIPCRALFIEMICQNIARQNYERAVTLVNCMVRASLHVDDIQWKDIFRSNYSRIGPDALQKFLDAVGTSDVVHEEVTVSNLLKCRQIACKRNSCNADELSLSRGGYICDRAILIGGDPTGASKLDGVTDKAEGEAVLDHSDNGMKFDMVEGDDDIQYKRQLPFYL